MSPRLTAAAACVLLLVAACGGSGPSATPTPAPAGATATPAPAGATATPAPTQPAAATATAGTGTTDPCSLFSAADLKTATGADYGAGVADAYGNCTWLVGGTVNSGQGQVVAAFKDGSLDAIKSAFAGGTDVTVSGHAGYWNGAQGLQSIWVDLSGRLLVLSFDPVGSDTQALAQQLAELALSHI